MVLKTNMMSLEMLIHEGIFSPLANTQFVIHFSVKGNNNAHCSGTIVLDVDNNKIPL